MTERLVLRPLRPEDADNMVDVLADERLHEFIGGRPANLDDLRDRYRRLAAGSSEANEVWLNWIASRRSDAQPVGTVQATLPTTRDGGRHRWPGSSALTFSARASAPKQHGPLSNGSNAAAQPPWSRTFIRITGPPPSSRSEPDCCQLLRKSTASRSGERWQRVAEAPMASWGRHRQGWPSCVAWVHAANPVLSCAQLRAYLLGHLLGLGQRKCGL
jgi:hypothetical protein